MVSCKHCNTQNSLDSTFCKRCGASIDEATLQEATASFEKLVEDGQGLLVAGRADEALAVADSVVLSNPSSFRAWSLKSMAHERRGEIAEALEAAERIVELNPDSELDRIKRNALRSRLHSDLRVTEVPDRRVAIVGALLAVVMIAALGAGFAQLMANRESVSTVADETPTTQIGQSSVALNPAISKPTPTPTPTPSAPDPTMQRTPGPTDVPAVGRRETVASSRNVPDIPLPTYNGRGQIPTPVPDGETTIVPVDPGTPKPPATVNVPPNPPRQREEDPEVLSNPPKRPVTPAETPGVISITVRGANRSSGNTSGSTSIDGNGVQTLLRVGGEQFTLQNYSGAARAYEQALQGGADAVSVNQRLGQAYERLGRNSDAAEAYRRCISAVESQMARGTGNRDRLESVKATAEQALKVLQGG